MASRLEGDTRYAPRFGVLHDHCGSIAQFAKTVVEDALSHDMSVLEACNSWHSGAYLLETVPSVLYILEVCGRDPEEAIVRAVNDTWDNDTIASIVGAAVGALHGKTALPDRWLDSLLGRTGANDDGRIFELIAEAKRVFFSPLGNG